MAQDNSETRPPDDAELLDLARSDPKRITDRLQGLSVRRQAEIALRLPPKERLEVLLHAPAPMRLVRVIPDSDFYLTVREVGPLDSLPLLALASAPQIQHLLDLESWRWDRFDADRAGGWLALLLEAGEPAIRRYLRNADDEALTLLYRSWARVMPAPDEEGLSARQMLNASAAEEAGVVSPDGHHVFQPTIPEHGRALLRLSELFLREDPERYSRILHGAMHELSAEIEELAFHWRESRLEEHGFLPWEEAIKVYAPPSGMKVRSEPPPPIDADGLPSPRAAIMELGGGMFAQAARDLEGPEVERVLFELACLANRVMVAERWDTGDLDSHLRSLRRAAAYLGIAIEARGGGRSGVVQNVLEEVPLLELFREGFERAAALQAGASRLVRTGWAAAHPRSLDLLDAPIGPQVRALLEPRPLFFDAAAPRDAAMFRDFRSLHEIEEARVALEMAEMLGSVFVTRMGANLETLLRDDPARPAETYRFSTLLLTALAWHAVCGEIRGDPLPPQTASRFLGIVAPAKADRRDAASEAVERFLSRLGEEVHLGAREVAGLRALAAAGLERLAESSGRRERGAPLDPRFVTCLILEAQGRDSRKGEPRG